MDRDKFDIRMWSDNCYTENVLSVHIHTVAWSEMEIAEYNSRDYMTNLMLSQGGKYAGEEWESQNE